MNHTRGLSLFATSPDAAALSAAVVSAAASVSSAAAAVVPASAWAAVVVSDELDEHPARPMAITDAAANAKILFFMLNSPPFRLCQNDVP